MRLGFYEKCSKIFSPLCICHCFINCDKNFIMKLNNLTKTLQKRALLTLCLLHSYLAIHSTSFLL